ncbi:MAG: magnesium transporter [Phycisphaerae bacterium]|nr:magnesium transporter [Phycisphaerae bacterium]MDW8261001.1 magnesium transporter [Phycisphaerales bacterium]
MTETLGAETLRDLLALSNPHAVNAIVEDAHPRDIAEAAADLDDDELWSFLTQLNPPLRGLAFSHLPLERQARLIATHSPSEAADVLEAMPSDDRVDVVQELDPEVREHVLSQMEDRLRRDVEKLEAYEEGTAGSVMSTDVATLRADMTVDEAVARLRELAASKETIYYNYVVDNEGRLLGIVSLRDLVTAPAGSILREVMNEKIVSVSVSDPMEQVAQKIREYDLLAMPVIDSTGRLAGIITVDDVLDVAEEEATEDFHKLAATGLGGASLKEAGLWFLYRRRIVWLLALVFVNVLSGAGIAAFEETIQYVVPLVFFLPLLIGSGGNAGSQSAMLMVRALATGDVVLGDWFRMLLKELTVAVALGATMAAGVSVIGAFRAPEVVGVVAVTMMVIVLMGSLIGLSLPFLLTRLNLDPAAASGPLITSLADICGVLIYFSIATYMLRDHIAAARAAAGAG